MKILVDADACPKSALNITVELGKQHNIAVWTIASFNHVIESDHHIMVGNAPQETDMKVINLTQAGDIVITQDWGLAALVLGKKAHCMHTTGWIYQPDRINFMLEEREMKAKLRRGGGRTKGPRKRSTQDDQLFLHNLEKLIRANAAGEM